MSRYAISYNINVEAMKSDGLSELERTEICQMEIPRALAMAGFSEHVQGSIYVLESCDNPLSALIMLQRRMRTEAPSFRKYCNRVHIFRVDDINDVTSVLTNQKRE